jgi:hypothetical protein
VITVVKKSPSQSGKEDISDPSNEDCDVGGAPICERLYVSGTMSFWGI